MSTVNAMRIFHIVGNDATELATAPRQLPSKGFLWLACSRSYFSEQLDSLQALLQSLAGTPLVDLHVSDLLNPQLPSHYDYTSQYDLLVIRRLATTANKAGNNVLTAARRGKAQPVADNSAPAIDTTPVGFACWERLLLSVHPDDCSVRDAYARRLLQFASFEQHEPPQPPATPAVTKGPADQAGPQAELPTLSSTTRERLAREDRAQRSHGKTAGNGGQVVVRLPSSPPDLMMRMVNLIVDNYLDLRRELSRHLDQWQSALLAPRQRIANWQALLQARLTLHQLDEICEDQRAAVQDWVDSVEAWPQPASAQAQRELEALKVRSRDVLEHIERVVHHVRRLEQSTETAVQMHFSVQSNRTNDIMRTLTTITAIFLPLNLIAAVFGMNFEFIPFVHKQDGFFWALGLMGVISVSLIVYFWSKQYLTRSAK